MKVIILTPFESLFVADKDTLLYHFLQAAKRSETPEKLLNSVAERYSIPVSVLKLLLEINRRGGCCNE